MAGLVKDDRAEFKLQGRRMEAGSWEPPYFSDFGRPQPRSG